MKHFFHPLPPHSGTLDIPPFPFPTSPPHSVTLVIPPLHNGTKKDPQPNRLRVFRSVKINALRTEVHDERL